MAIPIIDHIFEITRDFFNSHRYLKLIFMLVVLLFLLNGVATFIAGFNVACTTEGEVRKLDSFTITPTLYIIDLANDGYFENGTVSVKSNQTLIETAATSSISAWTFTLQKVLRGAVRLITGLNSTEITELAISAQGNNIRDAYLVAHSTTYENNKYSFDLKDSVQYGCRKKTPVITFFRLDILDYRLWFMIFIIGELIQLVLLTKR